MTLQCSNKLLGWGWRIGNRIEKHVAVAARENHTLMFVEHAPRAFVCKIACGQAGDGHGALYELLCGAGNAQFNALTLEFAATRLPSGGLFLAR
jgi:hypothetical protein